MEQRHYDITVGFTAVSIDRDGAIKSVSMTGRVNTTE